MKKFYAQIAQLVDGAYGMSACLILTNQYYLILNYIILKPEQTPFGQN